jgi:hypothetical protein
VGATHEEEEVAMTYQTAEHLQDELGQIASRIESAAMDEDVIEWNRLAMRRDALPGLIRQARAEPVHQEIDHLNAELDTLAEEELRAREGPVEVSTERRHNLTDGMVTNRLLSSITNRSRRVGRELRAAQGRLAEIEAEGTRGS